jgi:hypothetical protein
VQPLVSQQEEQQEGQHQEGQQEGQQVQQPGQLGRYCAVKITKGFGCSHYGKFPSYLVCPIVLIVIKKYGGVCVTRLSQHGKDR